MLIFGLDIRKTGGRGKFKACGSSVNFVSFVREELVVLCGVDMQTY